MGKYNIKIVGYIRNPKDMLIDQGKTSIKDEEIPKEVANSSAANASAANANVAKSGATAKEGLDLDLANYL